MSVVCMCVCVGGGGEGATVRYIGGGKQWWWFGSAEVAGGALGGGGEREREREISPPPPPPHHPSSSYRLVSTGSSLHTMTTDKITVCMYTSYLVYHQPRGNLLDTPCSGLQCIYTL